VYSTLGVKVLAAVVPSVLAAGAFSAATTPAHSHVAHHEAAVAAPAPHALTHAARAAAVVKRVPVQRPRPTVRPAQRATSQSFNRPTTPRLVAPRPAPLPPAPAGPTSWPALNRAIAELPTLRPGVAIWHVGSEYGHWGATDLASGNITIEPSVPQNYLYSVVAHEWSLALTSHDYGYDTNRSLGALDPYYGQSGVYGAEYAADCMAILQGAWWTNFTSCDNSKWRAGAERLMHGETL
jgi:hypothetical protein